MADLSDEEKARLIADTDVKDPSEAKKGADEPVGEQPAVATPPEEKPAEGIEEGEPESPAFTKKFPNLKGDTPEEYVPHLEQAYQNSFTEALRLKKDLDEATRKLAQAPPPQPPGKEPETPPAVEGYDQLPEVQYIKAIQQRDMKTAFDTFAQKYPQVKDEQSFTQFRNAADPLGQAFFVTEGRQPTYDELFPRIAAYLGWQTTEAAGTAGQTIKESLSTVQANSATVPKPRQPRVTDAQVDAYLKMYPNKNRADVVKELSEAIS